jgi:hypothetical protein
MFAIVMCNHLRGTDLIFIHYLDELWVNVSLGGLLVGVHVIWPNIRGFKTGQVQWIFKDGENT